MSDAELTELTRAVGRLEGAIGRLLAERDEDNKRRTKQEEKVDGLAQGVAGLGKELVEVKGAIAEMAEPLSRFKTYERRGFTVFGCVIAAAAVTGAAVDDVTHWVGKAASWTLRVFGY